MHFCFGFLILIVGLAPTQLTQTKLAYSKQFFRSSHDRHHKRCVPLCTREDPFARELGRRSFQERFALPYDCRPYKSRILTRLCQHRKSEDQDADIHPRPGHAASNKIHVFDEGCGIPLQRTQVTGCGRVGIAESAAGRTVYVGNLPWSVSPTDIARELAVAASAFGDVEAVRVRLFVWSESRITGCRLLYA